MKMIMIIKDNTDNIDDDYEDAYDNDANADNDTDDKDNDGMTDAPMVHK